MAKKFVLEGILRLNNSKFMAGISRASRSAARFGKTLGRIGFRAVKAGAIAATAAVTAFGVVAARTIAGFGMEMSKVKALTGSTGKEFKDLTKKARDMGATTAFSASEAAAGMAFLAQAGFDSNAILKSSEHFLNLAAAGGLELANAMDIASNIMTPFSMKAEEAARVADVLAKTAASSNTNVAQLGEAFKKVAPISSQLGISFEETAAAIGLLGNAGIQASDAGTALKNIMARLVKPTSEVQQGLAALGVSAEDVNPATHSLAEIMSTLQAAAEKTGDRSKVAAAGVGIFGLRANAAGGVLMKASKSISKFKNELDEADGSAKKMAKTMMDNLGGDFKILKSVFAELQLAIGEGGLTSVLREAAKWATGLMQNFINSGKAKQVGKIIRDAADAFQGAFTNPELLMNVLGSGLKLAVTGMITMMYKGAIKTGEILMESFLKLGQWMNNTFVGVGTLLGTGFAVAVAELSLGLINGATHFIAFIQAGLEKATDALIIGLSKIPGLGKFLGIEGFEKSTGSFADYFKSYKDSINNSTGGLTGGISEIRDAAATAAAEALGKIQGKGTFSKLEEYLKGIASGTSYESASDEFKKAVEALTAAGKSERISREKAAAEKESAADKAGGIASKPSIKAAAKAINQGRIGDRDKWGFRAEGRRADGSLKLLGGASLQGAGGLGGGSESKTGGYGGWRFGDAKKKKAAIEAAKKKAEEDKLQIEANGLLKEQNVILKTALAG